LASLGLGALAVAFVFSFEKEISEIEILSFVVLSLSLHLLVSFAAFLPKKYNQESFWEFNKQLFLRILMSGLYSAVLFIGLALAIAAIKNLFDVEIYDTIFGHLFVVIAGLFNTLFFLSGVPEITPQNELELNYPKSLKNFTQYVLLPLISVYLIILIAYEIKIIVTFSLPKGWVSVLILVFAIFGILSFLLIHPIAKKTENLWMQSFNRWFYYLLIPLIGLLFWAIVYRISLYGFTPERYYVFATALWLTGIVAYFLVQKNPKIKYIPISLCVVALLTIIGPQSANTISKKSQLSRFESYMKKTKTEKLSFEQEQDLSSIVSFLNTNYKAKIFLPFANEKLKELIKKEKHPSSGEIVRALGFTYRSEYDTKTKSDFYYSSPNDYVENIHGYDIVFTLRTNLEMDCENCITIENKSYSIKTINKDYGLNLTINNVIIPLKINDFINNNPDFLSNSKEIIQKIDASKYEILIHYLQASGSKKEDKIVVTNYNLKILVKIKDLERL